MRLVRRTDRSISRPLPCRSGFARLTRSRFALAVVLLTLLRGTTVSNQSASIHFESNAFKVIGWASPAVAPSGGWAPVLAVYVEGAGDPLLGSYSVENRTLIFRPQFPLAAGVRYRAVFHQPGSRAVVEQTFSGPPRSVTPTTRVDRVYPTADVLPGNQLRLYVYFSAPMSRGEAARRIHLLDKDRRELTA